MVPRPSGRARMMGLWSSLSACYPPEEAHAEYSEICAYWGRLGGRETLRLYGREHFARMGRRSALARRRPA